MSKESYALTRLEEVVEVTRSGGKTQFEISHSIAGTDEEAIQVASDLLDERMSLLGARKVDQSKDNSSQFFYSNEGWKVSWNPKGPKPPWSENPSDN